MQDGKRNDAREKHAQTAKDAAQQGFLTAKTGDFSEAVGIHIDSLYKGKRSLDAISHYKVNPATRETNIRQQAGFAAEAKEVARTNSERAFRGDHTRVARTDDLGMVNDQLRDIVEVGPDGKMVPGSAVQVKFVGKSPEAFAKQLLSRPESYKKYADNDVPIMVASDDYDGVKEALQKEIDELQRSIDYAQEHGNPKGAAEFREQQQLLQKYKDNLRKSKVSRADATEARNNPKMSVGKDALRTLHRAGLEGAKYGAAIGGTISAMQHLVRVASGEEKASDALVAVGKETGKAAAGGYVTSVASTGLATLMRQSGVKVLQSLSKSGVPGAVITLAASAFSSIASWLCGEISWRKCLDAVSKNSISVLGGMSGALLGQMLIPIPVLGGIIGSLVGSALSGYAARITLTGIERAEAAEAHERMVREQCEAYIQQMNAYRAEMNARIGAYLEENRAVFDSAFGAMQQAMHTDDVEAFITGANRITTHLGGQPPITSMADLDRKMADDSFTFRL